MHLTVCTNQFWTEKMQPVFFNHTAHPWFLRDSWNFINCNNLTWSKERVKEVLIPHPHSRYDCGFVFAISLVINSNSSGNKIRFSYSVGISSYPLFSIFNVISCTCLAFLTAHVIRFCIVWFLFGLCILHDPFCEGCNPAKKYHVLVETGGHDENSGCTFLECRYIFLHKISCCPKIWGQERYVN